MQKEQIKTEGYREQNQTQKKEILGKLTTKKNFLIIHYSIISLIKEVVYALSLKVLN